MIHLVQMDCDLDLVPQAVFSRSIAYFSPKSRVATDDFDQHEALSFVIDNDLHFDLRSYVGHPLKTTTLYLEFNIREQEQIDEIIDRIIVSFALPLDCVLWRRGDEIDPGVFPRSHGRLREAEARLLVLKIASISPRCAAPMSEIKRQASDYIFFSTGDLALSTKRPNEKMWQQVIGNVVSHKAQSTSIFSRGFARHENGYIKVTVEGLQKLNELGFSPA